MNNRYIDWLDNLKLFWLNKEIDKIVDLFSKDVDYYETPFQKVSDIKQVWNDNGKIVDMVYEIEFNNDGKCNKFKQWWMIK